MSIEFEAAAALKHVALDESIKDYVLQQPDLYNVLLKPAMRFIGGETLLQCVDVAKQLNEQGHAVTIDFMGESTRDAETATAATREFLKVVKAITEQGLDASVSLDLSHIGMVIDPGLCYENTVILAEATQDAAIEVMISMEGPDRTNSILNMHERICERFNNVGITLQAYLYRTPNDLMRVLQRPGKVRLVKGAYEASSDISLNRGADLDTAYKSLIATLFANRRTCSLATHDEALLDEALHQLEQESDSEWLEFEMLKGVTPERLDRMLAAGYRTRVYLPYGKEWHLYLCNRLAEHPPNIYQAIADAAASSK
ncbi:MAG: proline dehydrogenase family protein [Cyanobacteria bacterium J06648_16]